MVREHDYQFQEDFGLKHRKMQYFDRFCSSSAPFAVETWSDRGSWRSSRFGVVYGHAGASSYRRYRYIVACLTCESRANPTTVEFDGVENAGVVRDVRGKLDHAESCPI